jgi:5-methyltetrahydropteroyltriglutamate--homocysteine methyltransferase
MQSYRAEHVGSLLRPSELLDMRAAYTAGRVDRGELAAAEDRAIEEAFARQRDIGLDILSDGEMRRGSWLTEMAEAVEGFVPERVELEWKGPGAGLESSTARSVGARLHKARQLTSRELPLLLNRVPGRFKITLPAPSNFLIASYKPGVTDKVYPSTEALSADLAALVRDEIEWLVDAGVAYIQLDAPYYSHYLDPVHRARYRALGRDPDRELDQAIDCDNAALSGLPREGATSAMHICRGNSRSRWYAEGGYEAVAEKLFGAARVDRFLLEYDTDRSGGFEPLRCVPRGKTVVLGLVTTKSPEMEPPEALERRIREAEEYVPVENLALSPQCGFASVAAGNLLTMEEQWRKLELVVSVARQVWGA